jgi:hypothetical protein
VELQELLLVLQLSVRAVGLPLQVSGVQSSALVEVQKVLLQQQPRPLASSLASVAMGVALVHQASELAWQPWFHQEP